MRVGHESFAAKLLGHVEDVVDLTAVPEPLGAIQDLGVDQFEQTDALGDPGAGIEDAPPLTPEEEERERRRFEAKKVLENRWEAKWMIIGPTLVIVLAMTAAFLYFVLLRQDAEELLDIAEKSYRSQSYAEAIENYGKFLRSHPRHPEASKARVRQGLGKIRTFSDSNVYDKALLALPEVLPEIENEEAFPDEGRPELTSILPDIALGFVAKAERASVVEDKEAWVDKCEQAMEYVGNAMYLPTSARKQAQTKLDDLAARLETVNRDIQREKQLVAVIAQMDVAISQDETTDAFILRKISRFTRRMGSFNSMAFLSCIFAIVSSSNSKSRSISAVSSDAYLISRASSSTDFMRSVSSR